MPDQTYSLPVAQIDCVTIDHGAHRQRRTAARARGARIYAPRGGHQQQQHGRAPTHSKSAARPHTCGWYERRAQSGLGLGITRIQGRWHPSDRGRTARGSANHDSQRSRRHNTALHQLIDAESVLVSTESCDVRVAAATKVLARDRVVGGDVTSSVSTRHACRAECRALGWRERALTIVCTLAWPLHALRSAGRDYGWRASHRRPSRPFRQALVESVTSRTAEWIDATGCRVTEKTWPGVRRPPGPGAGPRALGGAIQADGGVKPSGQTVSSL
jgi:hypothetical protein